MKYILKIAAIVLSVSLLLVATTLSVPLASAHGSCNVYSYSGYPNPQYPNGYQTICTDNDGGGEYYTYYAWNMDGHLFQHQDQFRKGDLFLLFYYGLKDPNGSWQWQQEQRFDLGDYTNGGINQTHEFAMQYANGAWQHEYAWRNSPNDYYNYCYAQSGFDENGNQRDATYFCNLASAQTSGDASPVPLQNPSFLDHTDW